MKETAMILWMILSTSVGVWLSVRTAHRSSETGKLCDDMKRCFEVVRCERVPMMRAIKMTDMKSAVLGSMRQKKTENAKDAYLSLDRAAFFLDVKDWDALDRFFAEAGTLDYAAQSALFEETLHKLENNKEEAKRHASQYGRLYAVLGLTAGIFGVVLLL